MRGTFSEKGGRDVAYLLPTKVFLKPVTAAAMYFSLCAKAHPPPSIIPFLLAHDLPYTQVNKRIRLFPKLQGNMRLLPNMRLIMKAKIDHTPKLRHLFGSTCT